MKENPEMIFNYIITGAKCGAILIDQAFMEFLQSRVENIGMDPEDVGTGGHMVLNPIAKLLLDRFQKVKHAFEGTQDGQLILPKNAKVVPGAEDSIAQGELTLTALVLIVRKKVDIGTNMR